MQMFNDLLLIGEGPQAAGWSAPGHRIAAIDELWMVLRWRLEARAHIKWLMRQALAWKTVLLLSLIHI